MLFSQHLPPVFKEWKKSLKFLNSGKWIWIITYDKRGSSFAIDDLNLNLYSHFITNSIQWNSVIVEIWMQYWEILRLHLFWKVTIKQLKNTYISKHISLRWLEKILSAIHIFLLAMKLYVHNFIKNTGITNWRTTCNCKYTTLNISRSQAVLELIINCFLYSPTLMFTRIWHLTSVNFRPFATIYNHQRLFIYIFIHAVDTHVHVCQRMNIISLIKSVPYWVNDSSSYHCQLWEQWTVCSLGLGIDH